VLKPSQDREGMILEIKFGGCRIKELSPTPTPPQLGRGKGRGYKGEGGQGGEAD
jgi:hypothetical protein